MRLQKSTPDLKQYLANSRWEIEIGGIVINGLPVATDDRSKLFIKQSYDRAKANPNFTRRWKAGPGNWIHLNAQTIIAIGDAVEDWVAQCFDAEEEVNDEIDAGTVNSTVEIDLSLMAKLNPVFTIP